MNKIFRIVFNAATGRYVVASEMAKTRGRLVRAAAAGAALTVAAVSAPAFATSSAAPLR